LQEPEFYDPEQLATSLARHPSNLNYNCVFSSYGGNVDVDHNIPLNTTHSLPPAIILDYVYGIAAYMQWRSTQDNNNDIHSIMESYRQEHYMHIPVTHGLPGNGGNGGDAPEVSARGDRMSKAMDDLNLLLMSVEGITPQEAADRREKRMEEEELRAQEAGRRKVTEWMDTSSADGL
jgi:hypothetical protein